METDNVEQQSVDVSEEIESQARALGWKPKDQWRYDDDSFLDAPKFLEKGKKIIPFLKGANKDLEVQLNQQKDLVRQLQTQITSHANELDLFREMHIEIANQKIREVRKDLIHALKEAKKEQDYDREVDLQEQLKKFPEPETSKPEVKKVSHQAEIYSQKDWDLAARMWGDRNPEFLTDESFKERAIGAANILTGELSGKEALAPDQYFRLLDQKLNKSRREYSKVSSGTAAKTVASSSFDKLPKEVRDTCNQMAESIVKPGTKFSTLKDFQEYYTQEYNKYER